MSDSDCAVISPRFGILQEFRMSRSPLCYDLFVGIALGRRKSLPHISLGIDFNERVAKVKTINEGLERYASCIPKQNEVISAKRSELSGPSIGPNEFFLFSEQQTAEASRNRFSEDVAINWLPFASQNGQKVYLPESSAFLKNHSDCDFIPTSSSGCAAGASLNSAKLTALLEVLERDAIMVHWRTGTSPLRIEINLDQIDDPETRILISNLPHQTLAVDVYQLPTEFNVCTLLVVGMGKQPNWPAFISAAGSHPNKNVALKKALLEFYLATTLFYNNLLNRIDFSKKSELRPETILSFSEHATYYYFYENLAAIVNFLDNSASIPFSELPNSDLNSEKQLNSLFSNLEELGYISYFYDHTTRDVVLQNLHVLRCVVPGLAMIHARHKDIMLNSARFQKFLKFQKKDDQIELNRRPHFFP